MSDRCCEIGLCERDAEHCFTNAYGDEARVCSPCAQRFFTTEYLAKVNGPRRDPDVGDWQDYSNTPEFEETEMLAEAEYNARMDYLRDMQEAS